MRFRTTLVMIVLIAALGQGIVTAQERTFVPGDTLIFEEDFAQCPVGELPSGFDRITGAVECVRHGNRMWLAGVTGPSAIFKRVSPPASELSIEYDLLFLKGECGETTLELFGGSAVGKQQLPHEIKVGPGCAGDAAYVSVGGLGRVLRTKTSGLKRAFHVAVQIRRGQLRLFLNGVRLAMVPFHHPVTSFALLSHGRYAELISSIRVTTYSRPETPPLPELGITVRTRGHNTIVTVPEHVLFGVDEFFLKPEARRVLAAVAALLRKHSGEKIQIVGYTDSTGSHAHNLLLSLQRAQSVADELMYVERISHRRISIAGAGESNPVSSNATAEGRTRNRRVEITLLG